jgi:putative transposase
MPRPAPALALSASQKAELEGLLRSGSTPQKVALRCRLLLLAHQGVSNQSIGKQLELSRPTIVALREAFAKDGLAAVTGIRKRHRRGSVLTPELEQKIVDTTVQTRPGDGSTHWSVRMLARQLRVSRTIVHRVWQRRDVQPHRVEKFKLSNDPHFEEKVRDVVGLYLNPPERALVLCVDEKSQIQALDRTAPILPLRPACRSVKRTTINAMAPPLCSPRSTFSTAK